MVHQIKKPSYAQLEKELAKTRAELSDLYQEFSRLDDAYDRMQQNQVYYRQACGHFLLGYVVIDINYRTIDVSKSFSDFFGYSHEEILGMRFVDLLADDTKIFADLLADGYCNRVSKNFYTLLAEQNKQDDFYENAFKRFTKWSHYHKKRPFVSLNFDPQKNEISWDNLVWNLRKKDGSSATVMIRGKYYFDRNGHFIKCLCSLMDFTEFFKNEEELCKSEEEKKIILETMSERVIYHDKNRRIVWANHVAAKAAGMPLDRMTDVSCFTVFRNRTTPCEECPVMMVFETGTAHMGEIQYDETLLEVTAHPVFDGDNNLVGVVQVSVDITERKQLELELLNVSCKERRQIGENLHDGLGQHLTGILYLATSLRNQLADLRTDDAETAARIAESADSALKDMRSIIMGLGLVPSKPQGLMTALSALAASTMNIYPIECTCTCDVPVVISDYTAVSHLFYIAQEAVCNAVKHSTCTTIHITLSQCRDRVKLLIRDNGNGLSMKSGEQSGMGLRSMRYRASIMGAKLEIRGTAGKGTTVSCQLPASRLRKKEYHHV